MKKLLQKILILSAFGSSLVPTLTFAQGFSLANSSIQGIITEIIGVIVLLKPILFVLAFIFFFWGLTKFILHADSKTGVEEGRKYMLWGLIAIFCLISLMGIISFITTELELGNPTIPNVLLPTNGT